MQNVIGTNQFYKQANRKGMEFMFSTKNSKYTTVNWREMNEIIWLYDPNPNNIYIGWVQGG